MPNCQFKKIMSLAHGTRYECSRCDGGTKTLGQVLASGSDSCKRRARQFLESIGKRPDQYEESTPPEEEKPTMPNCKLRTIPTTTGITYRCDRCEGGPKTLAEILAGDNAECKQRAREFRVALGMDIDDEAPVPRIEPEPTQGRIFDNIDNDEDGTAAAGEESGKGD